MRYPALMLLAVSAALPMELAARADVQIVVEHHDNTAAAPAFKFKDVPPPSHTDAAEGAKFSIIDGERDPNGGGLQKLNGGGLPDEPDQPEQNFFFDAGTAGGRIVVELDGAIAVKQINTYSWHPNTRGPQVYKLYAADGTANEFNPAPKHGADPEKAGWKLIASVDTRPKDGESGGQYGVSISDPAGIIGKDRYLLFDISRTEDDDDFGNTFFSEIDVIENPASPPTTAAAATSQPILLHGRHVTIDVTLAPDLQAWAETSLLPACDQWYPIIVKMLASEGFVAPESCTIEFKSNMRRGNPASTSGTRIACNIQWFRRNLAGEATGAVIHEMVHVVQQYGLARRTNPNATRNPGWMVEGIADYIRWFKYEPQSHGAVIRNPASARFDASYRETANFLNWVSQKYDNDIVPQMNAAMRQGKYSDELWKQYTGKTADELGQEWKRSLDNAASRTRPG